MLLLQVTSLALVSSLVALWEWRKVIPRLTTAVADDPSRVGGVLLLLAFPGLFGVILLGLLLALLFTDEVWWTLLSAPILLAPFFGASFPDAFRRPGSR